MKVACLGGGGSYFVRPLGDFALSAEMRGSTISMYDIDKDRARLLAETGRRFSRETGNKLKFAVASSLKASVADADFVLTSIGGAGASGSSGYYNSPVHLGDKIICARHGVPQVVGDTAGPSAMMAAFRSVPIHLNICRTIERQAPKAILLNHANPMAVLCRAMVKYSGVQCVVGICHGVQEGVRHAAHILNIPPEELEAVWIGTNHYYWFLRMRHHGRDVLAELIRRTNRMKHEPKTAMCADLSKVYGHWIVYAEDDHVIEFYPYLAQADGLDKLPYALSDNGFVRKQLRIWRGELRLDDLRRKDKQVSRKEMLGKYKDWLSKVLLPKNAENPMTGEGTARLIGDIAAGRRAVHICNIPNNGAVSNLPAEAILEVEAVTDSAGVRPLWAGAAPLPLEALLRKRIAWQELVVDAAVKGDKKLALQAMQVDECAISPDRSRKLLKELMENNRGMLPTFEGK